VPPNATPSERHLSYYLPGQRVSGTGTSKPFVQICVKLQPHPSPLLSPITLRACVYRRLTGNFSVSYFQVLTIWTLSAGPRRYPDDVLKCARFPIPISSFRSQQTCVASQIRPYGPGDEFEQGRPDKVWLPLIVLCSASEPA
jgi:hypothetical protein